jgi:hypothetical protein
MNFAMADAYIAGFKIRYVYDLWRPVTAIREGDNDGNDATAGDPTWDSHQNTPAVSDYPSTQSTFSAAAAVVLASLLGGQMTFTFTSGKPFDGTTRSFTSFSQAARESRLAHLCRDPLSQRLRGRARARAQGRRADGDDVPAATEVTTRQRRRVACRDTEAARAAVPDVRRKLAEGEGFEPPRALRPGGFQVPLSACS